MKKAFIVGLILTGCGPSFEPTKSSSVSTSQTESTTDVININDLLEIPVANCEDNFVYVPWTGYQLNDAPILSCMPLLLGQDSLQPKYFRYSLYEGKRPGKNVNLTITKQFTLLQNLMKTIVFFLLHKL